MSTLINGKRCDKNYSSPYLGVKYSLSFLFEYYVDS